MEGRDSRGGVEGLGGGGEGFGGGEEGHDVTPHPHPISVSLSSVLSQTSGHTEFVEAQLQLSDERVSSARHDVVVVLNHPTLRRYTLPPLMHQFLSKPHPKSRAFQLSSLLNPLQASSGQSPFIESRSS